MELDGTTFALEIVNFLILVWILKRFLYGPIREVVERRRQAIEKTLSDARAEKTAADGLCARYEGRLAEWEREREAERGKLRVELDAERQRGLEALAAGFEKEHERNRVLEERRLEEVRRGLAEEASTAAGRFAARLLSRVAAPDLEARIVDVFLEDLAGLPAERRQALKAPGGVNARRATVTTAFPLPPSRREAVAAGLAAVAGDGVACDFVEDPSLVAGIRLGMGPWVLRASLADELAFFAEASRGEPG